MESFTFSEIASLYGITHTKLSRNQHLLDLVTVEGRAKPQVILTEKSKAAIAELQTVRKSGPKPPQKFE